MEVGTEFNSSAFWGKSYILLLAPSSKIVYAVLEEGIIKSENTLLYFCSQNF